MAPAHIWAPSHLRCSCALGILSCFMLFFHYFLAVTISFSPIQYNVDESAGAVQLQLVTSGSINIPVTIMVSTMDGTAVG